MGFVDLPVGPPLEPMLARLSRTLPEGHFVYEPKWDGFRCIGFHSGPRRFGPKEVLERLEDLGDLYLPVVGLHQRLPK
jgi:hypothetical protein